MAEQLTDPAYLIPEAKRFEHQMVRVIEHGEATSWRGAEELLIASDIAPAIPKSQQRDYVEEHDTLWREVAYHSGPIASRREAAIQKERQRILQDYAHLAAGALRRTFAETVPEHGGPERIKPAGLIAEINESLDEGIPVSIAGFGRQGKTTLTFAVGESRNGLFVYSDVQKVPLISRHTADLERLMVFGAYSRHDRIKSVIQQFNGKESSQELWSALNDYAKLGGERVVICFDELGLLADEEYTEPRQIVAREMAEIVEFSNLDLLVVEHIGKSQFSGERQKILPPNIRRFIVPPVSGPEMFDFLHAYTSEHRTTFIPEAAAEIHDLTGGSLALAALVGRNIIEHTTAHNIPRFIYDSSDVQAWEDSYVESHKRYGSDEILNVLFQIFGNLNSGQQDIVEKMAESSSGVPYRGTPSQDAEFLIQTNVAMVDMKNGRLRLKSRLLQRLMQDVKTQQEIAKSRKPEA